jgi:hypothetical protein
MKFAIWLLLFACTMQLISIKYELRLANTMYAGVNDLEITNKYEIHPR